MSIAAVLRDHSDDLRTEQLAKVIEAVGACAAHCDACADACLEEGDPSLTRCIRGNLDCADICTATAKVVSRAGASGAPWIELVQVCADACASCAQECESHADHHEHCRVCAQACRAAEQACRELVSSVG